MSHDAELKVTYASLHEASEAIKKQANLLEHDLNDLLGRVRAVSAHWDGEAKQAFDAVAREWENRTHHMHEVLESIAGKVQIASGSYSAADKKAAGYFG